MDAALWGFIGTLIGALASLGGTWLTSRHASSLHATTLGIERDEKFRIFQRDTLIALQDALHDLLRFVARGHIEDTKAFHETGEWGKEFLSEEVSEGQMLARRHMLILVERVADDDLRTTLKRLNTMLTNVSFGGAKETADQNWEIASIYAFDVFEQIGKVLRGQY